MSTLNKNFYRKNKQKKSASQFTDLQIFGADNRIRTDDLILTNCNFEVFFCFISQKKPLYCFFFGFSDWISLCSVASLFKILVVNSTAHTQ